MIDFLFFRRMLTPMIIQLFFWLGVISCLIGGIINLAHHAIAHGLQVLILGPILLRIFCELLLIIFRINETLAGLKSTVQEKS